MTGSEDNNGQDARNQEAGRQPSMSGDEAARPAGLAETNSGTDADRGTNTVTDTGRHAVTDEDPIHGILAAIPLPVVLIGADDRILGANQPAEAILGPDQIGRHHAIALRQPAVLAAIEAARHRGIRGQANHVILGPTQEVTFLVTVTPVQDPAQAGAGRAVLCAFQNITEQELISQFRRDFVASISHELRTPLTALIGLIETLRGVAQNDPDARDRFLTIMAQEAERMNRLVHDLLSLSAVEARERQRPTVLVDVCALVDRVAAGLRPIADAAGVELVVSGADHIPKIPADADQLTQILQNLAENAIKYGAPGKTVTIAIQLPEDEPMLRIDVIDQGAGIPARHLPRLTERFYRIESHRSGGRDGIGLGLAIVKHIIHRHRGRLVITSKPGKGSCFSVFLPKA